MNKECFIQVGEHKYPLPTEDLKFILLEAHWGFRMAECSHNMKGKRFPKVWKKRMEHIEKILEAHGWKTHETPID